jgi:hypothetical protein
MATATWDRRARTSGSAARRGTYREAVLMNPPAHECAEPATYHIVKRCPSCRATYMTTSAGRRCPSCGAEEDRFDPLHPQMTCYEATSEPRLVRNWPLTFLGAILFLAGAVLGAEAALRLAMHSFGSFLHRFGALSHLAVALPLSPVEIAGLSMTCCALAIACFVLAKREVVDAPRLSAGPPRESVAAKPAGPPPVLAKWTPADREDEEGLYAAHAPVPSPAEHGIFPG